MSTTVYSRIILGSLLFMLLSSAQAVNFNQGAKKCQECHEQEYDVWKNTPHFTSYKSVHKSPEAKKILADNNINTFSTMREAVDKVVELS